MADAPRITVEELKRRMEAGEDLHAEHALRTNRNHLGLSVCLIAYTNRNVPTSGPMTGTESKSTSVGTKAITVANRQGVRL